MGGTGWKIPKNRGRTLQYLVLRAHELVCPRDVYGKPWLELDRKQQMELLGYTLLRLAEEGGQFEGNDD